MDQLRQTALRAAREAGSLLRQRLGNIKNLDYKGAFNIVTDVDRASEAIVVEILRAQYPDHGILGEEGGATGAGQTCRWIIDPLDGTTNYAHAYPFFSVSIGFEAEGQMILGVVYNPVSEELFLAESGMGAWLNEQKIHVSTTVELSASLLATGFPPDTSRAHEDNMLQFSTLTNLSHGVRRDGSAALDLCFVACGRTEGFWEMKLSPWDTAAGSLIVKEAGGRVTNLSGGKFDLDTGHILATNGSIHDEVVQILIGLQSRRTSQASTSGH